MEEECIQMRDAFKKSKTVLWEFLFMDTKGKKLRKHLVGVRVGWRGGNQDNDITSC